MLNTDSPSVFSAELSTDFDSRELNRRTPGVGIKTGNTIQYERGSVYLGIDPGLNRTGYAVLRRGERPFLLEGGIISSSPKATLAERVREIGDGIREILNEFKPDAVAIEQVFSMVKNPKTAILMAHARGAILYAISETERPIINYSPKQVKKLLTGSGTASKEQVQEAIRRELGLAHILEPNDVADACAIALCHYHSLSFAFA